MVSLGVYDEQVVTGNAQEEPEKTRSQELGNSKSEISDDPRSEDQNDGLSSKRKANFHKKKFKKSMKTPELDILPDYWQGSNASKKLTVKEWVEFILSIFGCGRQQKWTKLTNPRNVRKVVFCFLPGIQLSDFLHEKSTDVESGIIQMPHKPDDSQLSLFHERFSHLIPTMAPGNNESIYPTIRAFLNIKKPQKSKDSTNIKADHGQISLDELVLTDDQIIENDYPMEMGEREGWVSTRKLDRSETKAYALDCEFCSTRSGQALTRITMINFEHETLIESLVKPPEEIIDYKTMYSGITEEMLENITTSAEDIQKKILEIVSSHDILIGHSLESDLSVLKIQHTKVIDTSIIYDHANGPPSKPSLKWLCQSYLNRSIQQGEVTGKGHSSAEDAKACLDLVLLKLKEGIDFGKVTNEMPIFSKIDEQRKMDHLLIDYDHSNLTTPVSANVKKIRVKNDDEIVDAFERHIDSSDFVVARFRELDFNLKWSPLHKHYNGVIYDDANINISQLHEKLNRRLNHIYSLLPSGSVFIVSSSSGDPREHNGLLQRRRIFKTMERSGQDVSNLPAEQRWDFDAISQLRAATRVARNGINFLTLKQ